MDSGSIDLIPSQSEGAILRRRRWTWVSYRGSPGEQVVSVLGVIETLVASSAYGWIAVVWGTEHLAISGCVAFLLFLRTEDSVQRGLRWSRQIVDSCSSPDPDTPPPSLRDWFVMAAIIGLVALLVRVGATVVSTIRHPLKAFRSVPENWFRVSVCTDLCTMPEAVAGIDSEELDGQAWHELISMRSWLRELRRADSSLIRNIVLLRLAALVVFVALPAFFYRIALEGTSIFYSVLMFKMWGAFSGDGRQRIRVIREQWLGKLVRLYSALVIVYVCSRFVLASYWLEVARWLAREGGFEFFLAYLVGLPFDADMPTAAIPRWQLAAVFSAIIVWVVFFVADSAHVKGGASRLVNDMISGLLVARSFLTFYTLWASIYVALSLVGELGLPPIGDSWFPFESFDDFWHAAMECLPSG